MHVFLWSLFHQIESIDMFMGSAISLCHVNANLLIMESIDQ